MKALIEGERGALDVFPALSLAKKTCFRLVFVEVDVRGANALREAAALSACISRVPDLI
jgi:hypothetical protein